MNIFLIRLFIVLSLLSLVGIIATAKQNGGLISLLMGGCTYIFAHAAITIYENEQNKQHEKHNKD